MTTIAVGTDKGLFSFAASEGGGWEPADPQLLGWQITALGRAGDGTYLAGAASGWYGPAIQRSDDLVSWQQVSPGPQYAADGARTLERVWRFAPTDAALWVGVAEAGLFRSDDHGLTWEPVPGLNDHPTSRSWMPGAGGMCTHAIIEHPDDPDRLWCGISAVGVFRTDDGGGTWELRNSGVERAAPEEDGGPDVGYCVHGLAQDPEAPDTLYRQDHTGVYRTRDGADTWERIETGLPARFGFPIVADAGSGRLFVAPQHSDERRVSPDGRFRVWRSDDRGDSWQVSGSGWPSGPRWAGVLRGAMTGDGAGTVAAGTTSGEVWVTTDAGDHWEQLDVTLPRIHAVTVLA